MSVSLKKERLECTDLSLVSPSPETITVGTDSELRLRLCSKRPAVDDQGEQSKRSCAGELSIVPWSAPSGEKRTLEVDEEMQSKKQCISERESPLTEVNDEILWCEMMDSNETVIAENEVTDDHEVVEMEQLVQGAAKERNELGANVHEKSLIWAARDTERKKLEEKGAVRLLSSDSAEKARTQFVDRFIPSRFCCHSFESWSVQGSMVSARLFGSGCHGTGWWWLHPVSKLCLSWDACCRVKL